jgi:hypothetical protein
MEMHFTLSWLMTSRRQLALTTVAASSRDTNCNTYGTYECRSPMESTIPANEDAIIAAVELILILQKNWGHPNRGSS